MTVDLRLLRALLMVAEERHLTRAASRLYVSQPALTKQIRALEEITGLELFQRTRAGMEPTAAGEVLARHVPDILRGWHTALEEATAAAAQAEKTLRVGFIGQPANEYTQPIVDAFCESQPGWRVVMRENPWTDPSAGMAGREVDVAFVRLPFPGQENFGVLPLFCEPRWVMLPADHPLARLDEVKLGQLAKEPFIALPEQSRGWRRYWLAEDH
jgi:DNA-binding transcriptional LysR family regulator